MAIADPLDAYDVAGGALSLDRVSTGPNTSTYRSANGAYEIVVSHQYGKRTRRQFRLNFNKIAADPLTADNVRYSASVYVVADIPVDGFTSAEVAALVKDLANTLGKNSFALVDKFSTGQN